MKTSSKYRRLIRQKKLRKQRTTAFLVFMALLILVANVALSNQSAEDAQDVVAVRVLSGDTIWSIAKEYKPEGVDFNEYIHSISANNGIKDGNIYAGQVIYVPVEA